MPNDTLTRLRELRLAGMAAAAEEQATNSASSALGFEERLALVVDPEVNHRNDKRVAGLLKRACLKYPQAAIEDIDTRPGLTLPCFHVHPSWRNLGWTEEVDGREEAAPAVHAGVRG
jgi:hypothetical protein